MKRAINIKCTISSFFEHYLVITKAYHGLTNKEIEYTARFMYYYNELAQDISKDDLIFDILFNNTTKKKIIQELDIDNANTFSTTFNTLKKKGIVIKEFDKLRLNKKYCIKLDGSTTNHQIIYNLILKDDEK